MRTTVILNLKGGVGKTTTVIHMAGILARDYGKRVLVVDCDHQKNLSQYFDADPENGNTAEVMLNGDECYAIRCIQTTGTDGVDILAGDEALMELDLSQLHVGNVHPEVFRGMVQEIASRELYDYVLYDCPPAFNSATAAALMAADDVVIPIKIDAYSVSGMTNVMRQVRNMQRINYRLRISGILPTMWYNSRDIREAEDVLRASKLLPVYPHIRRSNRVDGVSFARELSGNKTGHMQDYRKFVAAYVGGNKHG